MQEMTDKSVDLMDSTCIYNQLKLVGMLLKKTDEFADKK